MRLWKTVSSDIPRFFKNVWAFRKELWHHRWYNWEPHLSLLRRSLEIAVVPIEIIGHEVEESRLKKVNQMKRAIELIKNFENDDFIPIAEAELGKIFHNDWEFEETSDGYLKLKDNDTEEERLHNRKVFDRAYEIEEQQWAELWKIIAGQERSEFRKIVETAEKGEDVYEASSKHFDGTCLRTWWD